MILRGTLIKQASLADYTAWRTGGCARQLYRPADIEDLQQFLQALSFEESLLWLGLGSNLLVRDQGFQGTVIVTQGALNQMMQTDTYSVRFAAGVPCGTAARFCARLGLTGLEFLAGVPGTIGGALRMNAGAHGGETWQFVTACETIDRQGNLRHRPAGDYQPGYRHVALPAEEWFIAGHFTLQQGDKNESLAKIKTLLAHRAATQPINYPNCGSVFRNPPQQFAAQLIEACGLKGKRIGGASISCKHANFIINDAHSSAKDIEALIQLIKDTVNEKFGVLLQPEVHIVGDASD